MFIADEWVWSELTSSLVLLLLLTDNTGEGTKGA
jgi:hypothetical protein